MSKIKDKDAGYAARRVASEQATAKLVVQSPAPSAPSKEVKTGKKNSGRGGRK